MQQRHERGSILITSNRAVGGGPRVAAEERGEMGDPAAGSAEGSELPDLVVLEIGVDESLQGRPLGGRTCAVAAPSRGVYRRCRTESRFALH